MLDSTTRDICILCRAVFRTEGPNLEGITLLGVKRDRVKKERTTDFITVRVTHRDRPVRGITLAFVGAHLAPHEHAVQERNNNFETILQNVGVGTQGPFAHESRKAPMGVLNRSAADEFDQVGGNAIFVNNYNRRTLIKGCHIHETGASGVCFVGDPDAVRDPLYEYGQKNDLTKIDRTPGPKNR